MILSDGMEIVEREKSWYVLRICFWFQRQKHMPRVLILLIHLQFWFF